MDFFDSLAESSDDEDRPYRSVKEIDAPTPQTGPSLSRQHVSGFVSGAHGASHGSSSFEQMTTTLYRNTCHLLGSLPSKSEHRRHLMATLLDGMSYESAATYFNLNMHTARAYISAPGKAKHSVERLKWLASKEKREIKRPKLSKEETLISFDAIKEKLKTRSGTANETYYYTCSESLYEEYVLQFRSAVIEKNEDQQASYHSVPTEILQSFPDAHPEEFSMRETHKSTSLPAL